MSIFVKTPTGLKKVTKVLTKQGTGIKEVLSSSIKQGSSAIKVYTNSPWKKLGNFPGGTTARPALFVLAGKMYSYGGFDVDFGVGIQINRHTLHRYDPSTDTWTDITGSGLIGIDDPVVSVVEDRVYILGTRSGYTGFNILQLKIAGDGTWTQKFYNVSTQDMNPHGWVHIASALDTGGIADIMAIPVDGNPNSTKMLTVYRDMSQVDVSNTTASNGVSDDYCAYANLNNIDFVLIGGDRLSQNDQWTVSRRYTPNGGMTMTNLVPEGISQQAFAQDATNFYMFGGTHREPGADGEYFPRKTLWKFKFDMTFPEVIDNFNGPSIRLASAAIVDGMLYVVGGVVDNKAVNTVYSYPLTT